MEREDLSAVAVCVPARHEGLRTVQLMKAIRPQLRGGILILFLDDGTREEALFLEQTARKYSMRALIRAGRGTRPNAGRARKAAMLLGLQSVRPNGVLLTTDADTVPAPDWVRENLLALANADLVLGDPELNRENELPQRRRLEAYLRALNRYRNAFANSGERILDEHPFGGGASLSISAERYRQLGGFADVSCGEDADLTQRAVLRGLTVYRCSKVKVSTSSRLRPRAEGGLGSALRLRNWTADSPDPLVEDPAALSERFQLEADCRRASETGNLAAIVPQLAALGISYEAIVAAKLQSSSPAAFLARLNISARMPIRSVSLTQAEEVLSTLFAPSAATA